MTSIKPCPLCGAPARYEDCVDPYIECDGDIAVCGIRLAGNCQWSRDGLIARWNALPRAEVPKAETPPFKYVALCHHGEEVRYPGYSRQALTGANIVFPTVTKPSVVATQIGFAETADGPLLLVYELGECIGYLCEARFSGLKDNRGA
jgi:hypothetical protein